MAIRPRAPWLAMALAFLIAFPASAGLALTAPAPVLAAAAPPPSAAERTVYYPAPGYDPMTRWEVEWRVLNDNLNPGVNLGVIVLDVTNLTPERLAALQDDRNLPAGSFERLRVDSAAGAVLDDTGVSNDERRAFQRQLYSRLGLGGRGARTGGGPVTDLLKIVVSNTAGDEHSEERFVDYLLRKDVAQLLVGASSERDLCPNRCDPLLREVLAEAPEPKPALSSAFAYGRPVTTQSGRTLSASQVNAAARDGIQSSLAVARKQPAMVALKGARDARARRSANILRPSGGCPETGAAAGGMTLAAACGPEASGSRGGLADALSSPVSSTPGGIDFSTLQLRYLADDGPGSSGGIRYAFQAQPGGGAGNRDAGVSTALQASDAFFVWLELSPSKFTVNLNPTEPDRIIDADFGTTDAGRILLQADLQMKKTTAALIHPDTPLGAQYWSQLQAGPDGSGCLSLRQWIVPGQATVRADGNQLYILDAPLQVEMESDYQGTGVAGQPPCAPGDQAAEQHNEAVFRSMILPRVVQAVNQAPEYAALRQVYLSRVAAEWYRQLSARQRTAYGSLVDRNDVKRWPARQPWSPRSVFDDYVRSYTQGEFNVTHTTREGNLIVTANYVFGGVDFTRVPQLKIGAGDFQKQHPGLTGHVQASFSAPVADAGGLLIGGTTVPPARPGGVGVPVIVVPLLVLAGVVLLALVGFGPVLRRRRGGVAG